MQRSLLLVDRWVLSMVVKEESWTLFGWSMKVAEIIETQLTRATLKRTKDEQMKLRESLIVN